MGCNESFDIAINYGAPRFIHFYDFAAIAQTKKIPHNNNKYLINVVTGPI